MCGIAGCWMKNAGRDPGQVAEAMSECLKHRGPDASGLWNDQSKGLAMAHRRLSILDPSESGAQPMTSADDRWIIAFNGEIYNFRSLKKIHEETNPGFRFRGGSDTEVLVERIALLGPRRAIAEANGMFAFAAYDRQHGSLWLARDRLGEKPLYYTEQGGSLYWASETKALKAAPGLALEPDIAAIEEFHKYGFVSAPRTIYRGVRAVPPGTLIEFRPGSARSEKYWHPKVSSETCAQQDFEEDELDALLKDAVKIRLESDVPLGAFLSGGIDSSLIVSYMAELCPGRVKTFTVGFVEKENDESSVAAATASHLGCEHFAMRVTESEAMDVAASIGGLLDLPLGDVSFIPSYLIARHARKMVTVALTGDGGDEVFAGYRRYREALFLRRTFYHLPDGIRKAAVACAALTGPRTRLGRAAELIDASDPFATYLKALEAVPACFGPVPPSQADIETSENTKANGLAREFLWDVKNYLPSDILLKLDTATMLVSLEGRIPLLDHRIVELGLNLPLDAKTNLKLGKLPLRKIARRRLPSELLAQPKRGFGIPLRQWMLGRLRDWTADKITSAAKAGGFVSAPAVRQVWEDFLRGARGREQMLWNVAVFEAWRQDRHPDWRGEAS